MSGRGLRFGMLLLGLAGLAACGGSANNGGGNNNSGGGGGTPAVDNSQPVVSNLGIEGNYADGLFTNVIVCVPGTSNCQTIDNVLVDTGSFGLRLVSSAVTLSLPQSKDSSGNAIGECTQFADSFNWGPVVTADVQLAGEKATNVPMQVLGSASFPTAPSDCTDGGLAENDSVATLGANGILGIGVFRHDCGDACAPPQTTVPAVYFSCATSTCTPALVAVDAQVQNPIWLLTQDNNGVAITLPSVGANGAPSASGTLTLGVNTESNNQLGSAAILLADPGSGGFATVFQQNNFADSILDSGSNAFFFLDNTATNLPLCAAPNDSFYCPTASTNFQAVNQSATGSGSSTVSPVQWSIANALDLFNTGNAAFNNLGGPNPGSFDFGLPFFFGRTVFVGINGTTAGPNAGPFFAY